MIASKVHRVAYALLLAGLFLCAGAAPGTGHVRSVPVREPGGAGPVRWQRVAPLEHGRSAHAVAADEAGIYVVGGTGGTPAAPVAEIERYDGESWTTIARMPGPGLNAPAAVILGHELYIIGGFNGTSNRPESRVRVLNLSTLEWRDGPRLPAPRGGHGAVVLGGKIHVLGGGNDRSTLDEHLAYDPQTRGWTTLAPLPRAEGSPAGVVYEGKLWAIGGRSGNDDFGDVYIYDEEHDLWETGPAIPPRGTLGAAVHEGAIWIFGGESQSSKRVLGEVLRLNPETRVWEQMTPLGTARSYARAATLGGGVLVIGGNPHPGNSHDAGGSTVVERMSAPEL